MAISTYQKPTIYRNLYENTGLVVYKTGLYGWGALSTPRGVAHPGHRQREGDVPGMSVVMPRCPAQYLALAPRGAPGLESQSTRGPRGDQPGLQSGK